jgi:hypothetical protein
MTSSGSVAKSAAFVQTPRRCVPAHKRIALSDGKLQTDSMRHGVILRRGLTDRRSIPSTYRSVFL